MMGLYIKLKYTKIAQDFLALCVGPGRFQD